jgi:histidinol-phosphate aminotransferase
MATQNVFVGRIWPCMPTYVRITVGTRDEMARFQSAFQKVMTGAVAMSLAPSPARRTLPRDFSYLT